MLKRLAERPLRRIILSALAGTALLAGCDQISDRLKRAQDVAETSAGQISGETIVDPSARNLETAAMADRALAGTVMTEFVIDDEERPLFAIGSIIAKPLDIAPVSALAMEDAALSADELEYFEEEYYYEDTAGEGPDSPSAQPSETSKSAVSRAPIGDVALPEQVLPKITLDSRAVAKSEQEIAQAGADVDKMIAEIPPEQQRLKRLTREEFKALPVEQKAEMRKLARRAPVVRETIKAQIDANSVMLDTMTKYGIGGEVALSRQGQMVIQIGADGASPTQFRGAPIGPTDFLVRADQFECPEGMQPEEVGANLALATACVVRDLRASGQFEYVEPDFIFQNQFVRRNKEAPPPSGTGSTGSSSGGTTTTKPPATTPVSFNPNDPLWALQWHFRDRGTSDGRTAGGAGFETFWNRQGTTGSRSVVVAVVDTGLQMSHPDIAASPNVMPGWDMVSDPRMGNDGDGRDADANDPGDMCDPTKPFAADSFHGTHVAGTIGAAATNNASGVAGGAWNVRIVPVRALGKCGGRLSDINDAIRWAAGLIPAEGPGDAEIWNENPADIINLSIGLLGACPASLQDAIDAVTERGAIVVSAAGNARMSTSFYSPAGCRNIVTVAASDARGQITPYSNYGPEVTLLAPGGDLTRDDNGDGKPDGVLSTKAATNCYDPVTGQGVETCYYAYEQGTSMAAPHVSAALALLKARTPAATKDQLIATLTGALDARQPLQCSGLCSQYPGTTPLPDNPDMCARPCGTGLLNLANIPAIPAGGGGR